MAHSCFALNRAHNDDIQYVPLNEPTSTTCGMPRLLSFYFWQKVRYTNEESAFPETSDEDVGRFSGTS